MIEIAVYIPTDGLDTYLTANVQLAYNTAVHTSTGVSPYEPVFNEHPRSKFEIITEKISPATVREKTERLRETVSEIFQKSTRVRSQVSEKRRERYNSKTSFQSLGVGQQVWKINLRAKTFADRGRDPRGKAHVGNLCSEKE